ncbi:hypothetical protein K488DRAFT_66890, partial [Vararia minispora EC-137]
FELSSKTLIRDTIEDDIARDVREACYALDGARFCFVSMYIYCKVSKLCPDTATIADLFGTRHQILSCAYTAVLKFRRRIGPSITVVSAFVSEFVTFGG